jgi:hypothetical protein
MTKREVRMLRLQMSLMLALACTVGSVVVWAADDAERIRALIGDMNGIYGWLSAQIQAAAAYCSNVVANIK